jgi:hypothetical protein
MIVWILVLTISKFVYLLSLDFFVTYNHLDFGLRLEYSIPYLVIMRPFNFMVDFLVMSTLLFLFYC